MQVLLGANNEDSRSLTRETYRMPVPVYTVFGTLYFRYGNRYLVPGICISYSVGAPTRR